VPACRVLGVLQVHLDELVTALRPSPQRCLALITALLPELANEVGEAALVHSQWFARLLCNEHIAGFTGGTLYNTP
jgi:hypothetical protein